MSGMAYWSAFYPADTVKSRVQTDPALKNASFGSVFKTIYQEAGFRGLYKVLETLRVALGVLHHLLTNL
eukprot:m.69646 g.69646  ORF g.69646 m.69646 type:complete len:69 (-) comp7832_c0_seq1:268-474(-)